MRDAKNARSSHRRDHSRASYVLRAPGFQLAREGVFHSPKAPKTLKALQKPPDRETLERLMRLVRLWTSKWLGWESTRSAHWAGRGPSPRDLFSGLMADEVNPRTRHTSPGGMVFIMAR